MSCIYSIISYNVTSENKKTKSKRTKSETNKQTKATNSWPVNGRPRLNHNNAYV